MPKGLRKSIFFVDDVKFSLITTKDRLKKHYEVYPAQSASEMFELLELTRPDLILLDINMPDVDGFEALRRLKGDTRFSDIPVIFLSALQDKKSVITGLSYGAAAHVCKPYSVDVLVETIDAVLNNKVGITVPPSGEI